MGGSIVVAHSVGAMAVDRANRRGAQAPAAAIAVNGWEPTTARRALGVLSKVQQAILRPPKGQRGRLLGVLGGNAFQSIIRPRGNYWPLRHGNAFSTADMLGRFVADEVPVLAVANSNDRVIRPEPSRYAAMPYIEIPGTHDDILVDPAHVIAAIVTGIGQH